MASEGVYRFDELGWLQFARLCAALLDHDLDWEDREYGRVAVSREPLRLPGDDVPLEPPTLVAVVWLRADAPRSSSLGPPFAGEAFPGSARSVLILSNDDTGVVAEVRSARVVALGPERLGALVDASEELRLRVPSVLGIRDLSDVFATEAAGRSTADLDALGALARVFVPTRAYERAIDVLDARRFAMLTGAPEMGKTAIARMVALAKLTDGWEAHECVRPEQLWGVFDSDRPQVFVADDAFGSTEYRPEAADRWALDLDRILRRMDDRHWLLWTSRPMPFAAGLRRIHREHGLERFPRPAEVKVDAAALGVDEKALILFRHTKAARLSQPALRLVRTHGWEIVSHSHFTPERIRRFVRDRLPSLAAGNASDWELADAVAAEIREPTTAMAASFASLAPEHRVVLLALLDAPPEPVPERELAAAMRRHSDTGFAEAPAELVGRLTDHFVRLVPRTSVAWVHPSWRDLVIAELAADADARKRFLERCGLEGILLALSVAGGVAGERVLPLLADDADWDTVAVRILQLLSELDGPSAIRLLGTLDAALQADLPRRARSEVLAVARVTLEQLARLWNVERALVPVGALEAWLALGARLPDAPAAPAADRTWLELAPTEPVDVGSRDELVRFDEWLALAGVLRVRAPGELTRFGFPRGYESILAAFVRAAKRDVSEELEPLVTRSLRSVRRAAPAYATEATEARWALAEKDDPWFEVRFETHARRPEPVLADRVLVERVLRDLG